MMKLEKRIAFPHFVVFVLLFIHCGCGPTAYDKFEMALNELKLYEFGDSRKALSTIESFVARTTDENLRNKAATRLATVLDSDISYAAKQFICSQLRIIGGDTELPVLSKLLQEEEFTDIALFAIEVMNSEMSDQVLREAITKLDGDAKIAVINAIGQRRDENAVDDLASLLANQNRNLAESAALALGKIGTAEAGKALKSRFEGAEGAWLEFLNHQYLYCALNLLTSGDRNKAVSIFRELANQDRYQRVKMISLYHLVSIDRYDRSAFISQAVRSDDPVMFRLAARAVLEKPGEETTLQLCEILRDLPERGKVLLIDGLSKRGDTAALPCVHAMTDHSSSDIRIASLRALASLGDASVVPLLLERSINAKTAEKSAALYSLYQLKQQAVNDMLITIAQKGPERFRIQSIKALTGRHAEQTVSDLLPLLADSRGEIRIETWKALAELASGKDLVTMLDRWLRLNNISEIQAAEDAAISVSRRVQTEEIPIAEMIAAVDQTKNKDIQISLINTLGRIGAPQSLPLLRELLNDDDKELRLASIRSLAQWPTDLPRRDLRKIVENSKEEKEKIIALQGYIQLIGQDSGRETTEMMTLYDRAMQLAWRPEEKRQILAGYAQVDHISALEAVEAYFPDDDLKNEAMAAAVRICDELIGEDPNDTSKEKIKAILKWIRHNSMIESIKGEANEILERME